MTERKRVGDDFYSKMQTDIVCAKKILFLGWQSFSHIVERMPEKKAIEAEFVGKLLKSIVYLGVSTAP